MNWFGKSAVAVEPEIESVTRDSHLEWDELRLLEVEKEIEAADQKFDDSFAAIREHQKFGERLASAQAHAAQARAALYQERARLLKVLGRAR